MLKGLEISIVKYSEIDFGDRIDSEYFSKTNIFINEKLNNANSKELRFLGEFVASAFYPAATQLYSVGDIPFVRCVDCINFPFITKEQNDTFEKIPLSFANENTGVNLIHKNDIVVTKVGSPCFASLIFEHETVALSRTVLGIKNIKNVNPFYLLVFLRCKYGFLQLLRARELTIQYQLTLERVRNILIFLPNENFQSQIERMVKDAHSCLSQSKSLYSQAEDLLLRELRLKDWQPDNSAVNIKNLKESFLRTGRLDSEYYLPRYEDYVRLVEQYRGGYGEFRAVCAIDEVNYMPSTNAEYKYIELGNIGNYGEITGCTVAAGKDLPSRARRLVRENDVILSSVEGSLQSCALVTSEYENAVCSTGFYVVRSDVMNPETLLMLFKSEPMQSLFKRNCTGTILTAISHNELQKIVVPKIRTEVQSKIAKNVRKSISLRNEAKSLFENAKQKVEDSIESKFIRGGVQVNSTLHENETFRFLIQQSIYYYRLAEWLLLQELFSQHWATLKTATYSIKSFSDFQQTGRLDAEYYQPKYDALRQKLSVHECRTLGDLVSIRKSVEPGSEAYKDDGIPFVRVSDVTKFGIEETSIFLSPNDFNLDSLKPKKNTILLSKDGSIGIAYKVEKNLDVITSGALLHLNIINEICLPDYLTLVLNSVVVKLQSERDSSGAIIQHWKQSDIQKVIIPILPLSVQKKIASLVQKSFSLKAQSNALLQNAKRAVEEKIEAGK